MSDGKRDSSGHDQALERARQRKETRRSVESIVQQDGVSQSVYLNWIKAELEDTAACARVHRTVNPN